MITITENAKNKVLDMLIDEKNPNLFLRTFVQGGGCSGFSYGFTFDEEKNEDDFEFPLGDRMLLIDSVSMQYLSGAVIDYKEDIYGSSFNIENPNAQTTCGCGSSFSVGENFYDSHDNYDHYDYSNDLGMLDQTDSQ